MRMNKSPPFPEGLDQSGPQHVGDPVDVPYNELDRLITLGDGFEGEKSIFYAAVQMTRMPMLLTDPNLPDNPIIFSNNAFSELTGYAPSEIKGRNCRFLQGPGTDQVTVSSIREAIAHSTDIAVEVLNYRKDGSAFWNALFMSPVFDEHQKLRFFFASQLDVSRRHDAEEALRQAQKMEAVGQLTGGIAHDFNNMLTVIMGTLARLDNPNMNSNLTSTQHRAVERAIAGCQKAEKLTAQLLTFARRQRLEARPTNLNSLVHNLKDFVAPSLGGHIEVILDLSPDLWIVDVDTVLSESAILNLAVNAKDAMSPEGGVLRFRTRNEEVFESPTSNIVPGRYSVLSVTDNGSGIPPDLIARVTEPFFTTKPAGSGTGMGLAMVYGFMRQSHGHLVIKSEVGKGTTIDLYFPVSRTVTQQSAASPSRRQIKGGNETIMVVEDNKAVMETAIDVLTDFGYHVIAVPDGKQALAQIIKGETFDMLFTDIQMPGINGITLAHEVRKMYPKMRVLLTTGYDAEQHTAASQRAGYEVIRKPYMPNILAQRIRQILDGPNGLD